MHRASTRSLLVLSLALFIAPMEACETARLTGTGGLHALPEIQGTDLGGAYGALAWSPASDELVNGHVYLATLRQA